MSNHPTVDDVMAQWLTDNGYDGLVSPDASCSCRPSDLRPCGDTMGECQPGHQVPCPEKVCEIAVYLESPCNWHIKAGPRGH